MTDLKSNNAEKRYLVSLDDKIDNVEKRVLKNEFVTAVFVSSAQMVLKLGIATTALAGSALLIKGELDILTFLYFCFWYHDFTTRCKPLSKTLPQ